MVEHLAGSGDNRLTHEVASFCRICNAMCGIVVTVDDQHRVTRVRGDDQHPLSRGYTCPKGRAIGQFHHDPRRLDYPEIRGDRVSWPEALDDLSSLIRDRIDAHGADSVGMYLASGSAFDTNGRRAAERFLGQIGSAQKYTAATIDTPSKPLVADLVGGWSGLTPVWDHEQSTLLVLIGSNPLVSHGHSNAMPDPVVRLREFKAGGGQVWVIDPRMTETAQLADRHLAPVPSTDHLVLAYLVRELLQDGADREYIANHARDLDVLAETVRDCTLELVARETNVAEADLVELLAAVRRAGRISALTGTGVSMGANANICEWMLWALHILTGSYDRPGGMWFNPGYLLQLDQRDWSASDGLPGPGPKSRPKLPRRFDEYPCAGLVPEIEAGNLKVLFVVGGNPICAFPGEARLRTALAQLDALIVLDVVRTDTTELATHLLPATGQLERADLPYFLDAYQLAVATQFTPAVVPPAAERWPMWRTFGELGERLGVSVMPRGVDLETATDEVLLHQLTQRSRGGADEVLGARSGVVHSGAVYGWVHERVLDNGQWRLAPHQLVDQFADAMAKILSNADDSNANSADAANMVTEPLLLIPQRQLRKMNSQLRDIGVRRDEALVWAHPDAVVGLANGASVTVTSPFGSTTGTLRLDDSMAPRAVSIPHGWDNTNVGALTNTDEQIDPHSGMVWQSGIPVTIAPTA